MRHHLSARAPALLLLTLGLLLCLGGTAAAQDYEAAGRHFAAAQDAFAKGEYRQAATSFKAAYDITRDPVLLFNIGESQQRAGDGPRAIASYRAYLSAQPQAADRPEVERRLRELEAAQPAGGDQPAGQAPAGQAPAGTPGAAPAPAPANAAAVTPPEERRQVAAASVYRTAAWATMAGTLAVATAAAVLGLGAQNRADELTRRTSLVTSGQPLEYNAAERDAYTTLMADGQAYNQGAIACLVVAGAAAVTSTVLFLIDWRRTRQGAPREPARAALRLLPGASPARPALSWSF